MCCGREMETRQRGSWEMDLKCDVCGVTATARYQETSPQDPFKIDKPLDAITEFQRYNLRRNWDRDGLGIRYQEGNWSECDPVLKEAILEWHWWEQGGGKGGLLVSGGVGTGKTVSMGMMMCCLAAKNDYDFTFWNTSELFNFFYKAVPWGRDNEVDAKKTLLRKSKYLFLDDIGVEYNSPMAMTRFNELIEYRHARKLHIIGTSNSDEDQLMEREGWARSIDRIQQDSIDWIELVGDSKRRVNDKPNS